MFKIPITIRAPFWIVSFLLAFLLSQWNPLSALLWEGIIVISILFHELGHACMALCFGQKCRIELVAMGGVTFFEGVKLKSWKLFLITLAGPIFGFLLGCLGYLLLKLLPYQTGFIPILLNNIKVINWFWAAVNLLPILPLDGGQLVRIVLEKFFHAKGLRYTFFLSMTIALFASLSLFLTANFFGGVIFFLFAYEGFEGWRRSKDLRDSDQNEKLRKEMVEAELLMQQGDKEEALMLFKKIQQETKEGLLFNLATQYTAFLDYESGRKKEAYEALKMVKDHLGPEGLCLLHKAAFDVNDNSLVSEIGGNVFQILPEPEVALRNATVSARLGDVAASIGWLETSLEGGAENLKEILQDPAFDTLRETPQYKKFQENL